MDKFEKFIKEFDYSNVHLIPPCMRRRLDAVKKIQMEQTNLLQQYYQELQELELKYHKLNQPLYEKRYKIINGEHEPTEEESTLPQVILDNDECRTNPDNERHFTDEEIAELETKVKGIPGFWLGCLNSSYNFNDSIETYDRPVLRHLKDITLDYKRDDTGLSYTLGFVFGPNPYFENEVLTKTYHLRTTPDEKDPFSYDGFEVTKSEGCEIKWKPGKNITVKSVTLKQQHKIDGRTRDKKKEVERDSFFLFFRPPTPPKPDELDEELGAILTVDYELGEVIRQSLIPKASLYYSGYLVDDVDDEAEEEGLDADDDESSSDDCEYGSDLDDSDESSDSLGGERTK